jgi:hypothetical protein
MDKLISHLLALAHLTDSDLAECASVNLPGSACEFLDLTPTQVVAALRAGDLDSLAESKTVWLSGWEPNENLRRLLAAVRSVLNARPSPPAGGRFYREVGNQLKSFGRIRHAQLLSWSDPGLDEPATSLAQRIALRLRGKIKASAATAAGLDDLRGKFSGCPDESH